MTLYTVLHVGRWHVGITVEPIRVRFSWRPGEAVPPEGQPTELERYEVDQAADTYLASLGDLYAALRISSSLWGR